MKSTLPTLVFLVVILLTNGACNQDLIDRQAVAERNSIDIHQYDSLSCLTVGNGNFAFTADITGLQTFPEAYNDGIPLGTASNWGWHSFPNTKNFKLEEIYKPCNVNGKMVNYVHDFRREGNTRRANASEWLRANPHRMNLGTLGFEFTDSLGNLVTIDELQNISQHLNPYTGIIESYFEIESIPVTVETVCDSNQDIVSVKASSPLFDLQRLKIVYRFSQADPNWKNSITPLSDKRQVNLVSKSDNNMVINRTLDNFKQITTITTSNGTFTSSDSTNWFIDPKKGQSKMEVTIAYSLEQLDQPLPSFTEVLNSSKEGWKAFWESGSAVDFSGCTDPRAPELERRIILSQYLTRVQCAGNLPPQETGLTFNSWHGKFHMEMLWWHGVHFALWNRSEILEKEMNYYFDILDKAKHTAREQGYEGVRWPKMTDPQGNESPSTVGTYLIWQQPHPIYLANLILQNSSDKTAVLKKYEPLIRETADFMASYPSYNKKSGYYDLGPWLIPAQERFAAASTINPVFELTYWRWGLQTAIQWLKMMNKEVPETWTKVLDKLAPLPTQDGLYLFAQSAPDSYSNPRYLTDHPMVLGIWGMLPKTDAVNANIFENTYERVKSNWHWEETWGWDFPMAAMAAAELGHPDDAIDFLLKDIKTNTYLKNGHNYQGERLPLYLPGNGALLTAVAQMCKQKQFPKNGMWKVKWEN